MLANRRQRKTKKDLFIIKTTSIITCPKPHIFVWLCLNFLAESAAKFLFFVLSCIHFLIYAFDETRFSVAFVQSDTINMLFKHILISQSPSLSPLFHSHSLSISLCLSVCLSLSLSLPHFFLE